MTHFNNFNILLGITGGIAAYKSAELVRLLKKHQANVRVVLTHGGAQFITPLTLQTLSEHPVHQELFDEQAEHAMSHIELARWADLILIAPATADLLAKLATGAANDLLSTLCLATTAPICLAPAMNQQMWQHPATQRNVTQLKHDGIQFIGPDVGEQACGEFGPGRMLEPEAILAALQHTDALTPHAKETLDGQENAEPFANLENLNILITAGPTQEAIDPVRYLSNKSSGKMGYALADAAAQAGANVTLISGPTQLSANPNVHTVQVTSAEEMHQAVLNNIDQQHILISAAAVADYTLDTPASQKMKKDQDQLTLTLSKTPDILKAVSQLEQRPFVVGFAAETEDLIQHATRKLHDKKCDLIIANNVADPHIGFDSDDNAVTLITQGEQIHLAKQSKSKLAKQLLKFISKRYQQS